MLLNDAQRFNPPGKHSVNVLVRERRYRFESAPALERGKQAGRELRILGIQCQHDVGNEIVTGAIGSIELLLICHGKGMNQRAYSIGIGK